MSPLSRNTLVLLSGVMLIFLTFIRYGIDELGWIAFAPLLIYAHECRTTRRHVALLMVVLIAFLLAVSKMATAEIPWAPVPLFAVPIAGSYFLALAFAGAAHRRLGPRWALYTFASMSAALGWFQYTFTPGSSWGAVAHTQVDNLALIQLAAITGIGGITFLVALGSGLAAAAWSSGLRAMRADLAAFGIVLLSALLFGQLRLGNPAPGRTLWVGGVVSPVSHADFRAAMTDVDVLRALDDELFARSQRAVLLGAEAVVWNEVATVVSLDGEASLVARGRDFAVKHQVLLLMAYGVVDSVRPFHYINKYRIYLPDGTVADEYVKRHPVPSDPNPKGTMHAGVVRFKGVDISGGICYDYGYPGIALDNARDGADLALVPSSDWRGIDPQHGRMALINAVAVGLPMVRPVRAATSVISDQYGRLIGTLRADSGVGGVIVVPVPVGRVNTLYSAIGEVVPIVSLAFCLFVLVRLLLQTRAARA